MVGLKKARLNKGNTNTLFDAYSEEEYEYDLAGNPYRYRVGSSAWNAVSSNKNNQTTQIDYASDAVLPVRGKASASATLNVSVDGVQQAYTRPNQEEFAIGLNAFSATKKYQEVKAEAVETDNNTTPPTTIRTMQRGKAYVEATPESFIYDANGNLLSDGRWNYTWDAENRLVEVETNLSAASAGVKQEKYVYVYDWTGRKIKSERYEYDGDAWVLVSTNKRYYDDYNLIYETTEYADGSSSEVRKYYYGTDLLGSVYGSAGTGGLRMMSINAEDLFVFNDQVGSVEALFGAETDTAAQVKAEYLYSSYGEVMMKSGDLADKNNIGYSTRYREGNTGLVGYTYRHYSPGLKKWLSKDPISEQGGLNLYQMVANEPVGYWDIYGYKIISDIGKTIGNSNSASASRICDNYDNFKNKCCKECCKDGEIPINEDDNYPKKAKAICKKFVSMYTETFNGLRMECVASCLVLEEEEIQKLKTCDERNAARLGIHLSCYIQCGFVPHKFMPEGAFKFATMDLMPSVAKEPEIFFRNGTKWIKSFTRGLLPKH